MIRQSYDLDANALYITVTDLPVARTTEIDPGTLVDLDANDAIVGIEIIAPERCWPISEILSQFEIASQDAVLLRAYFPSTAQLASPVHPSPLPVRLKEYA
jgi:uncharacterized protein YuzE